MNKLIKIFLAILAGCDTFIYIFTPYLLVMIFITVFSIVGWRANCFWAIGLLSILFRGIKVGWLKK